MHFILLFVVVVVLERKQLFCGYFGFIKPPYNRFSGLRVESVPNTQSCQHHPHLNVFLMKVFAVLVFLAIASPAFGFVITTTNVKGIKRRHHKHIYTYLTSNNKDCIHTHKYAT